MVKHFFGLLLKENLLGFLLVTATTISLAIQAFLQPPFEWIRILPIAFTVAYLAVHLRNIARLAKQTYYAVPIPYSVCLGQTHDWFESAQRQQEQKLTSLGLAWPDIQRTYRLHRMDWSFFDEHRLGLKANVWVEKVREICRHFEHLSNRIPSQPVYHVFLATPGTLALAIGAKIGRRIPVIVYQHAGMVKDPYVSVFDTENIGSRDGYHLLNQRISDYKLIEMEAIGEGTGSAMNRILVVLDFTGHELRKPYPGCGAGEIIRVRLRASHGHIPLDSDWVAIAHEISSSLFAQLDRDREVHLLPGIPASLAFVLGTALGATPGIFLYHFNLHDGAYTEPFALHEL